MTEFESYLKRIFQILCHPVRRMPSMSSRPPPAQQNFSVVESRDLLHFPFNKLSIYPGFIFNWYCAPLSLLRHPLSPLRTLPSAYSFQQWYCMHSLGVHARLSIDYWPCIGRSIHPGYSLKRYQIDL